MNTQKKLLETSIFLLTWFVLLFEKHSLLQQTIFTNLRLKKTIKISPIFFFSQACISISKKFSGLKAALFLISPLLFVSFSAQEAE